MEMLPELKSLRSQRLYGICTDEVRESPRYRGWAAAALTVVVSGIFLVTTADAATSTHSSGRKSLGIFLNSRKTSPESLLVTQILTQSTCYSSSDQFRGCIAALDALSNSVDQLKFVPNGYSATTLQTNAGLKIVSSVRHGNFFIQSWNLPVWSDSTESLNRILLSDYLEWAAAVTALYQREVVKPTVDVAQLAKSYLERSRNRDELILSALDTYFRYSRQDPHTYVTPLKSHDEIARSVESEASLRVGFQDVAEKGGSRVSKLLPNSPAYEAGLHEGDLIIAVNGSSGVENSLLTEIHTAPDRRIVLTVKRNEKLIELPMQARELTEPHVSTERLVSDGGQAIGYLQVRTFSSQRVCSAFRKAMSDLIAQGVDSWIIDLRGNGGGSVRQAECISGHFLNSGHKMFSFFEVDQGEVTSQSSDSMSPSDPADYVPGLTRVVGVFPVRQPLVVLMDEGSASASELMAGGLRFHGRALIVGLKSFGKGSLMAAEDYFSDRYLTLVYGTTHIARFPDGTSYHTRGINPDFSISRGDQYGFQKPDYSESEGTLVPPPVDPGVPQVRFRMPREFADLQNCLSGFAIQSWYRENLGGPFLPDQQKRYAQEVLRCWEKVDYPVSGAEKNHSSLEAEYLRAPPPSGL